MTHSVPPQPFEREPAQSSQAWKSFEELPDAEQVSAVLNRARTVIIRSRPSRLFGTKSVSAPTLLTPDEHESDMRVDVSDHFGLVLPSRGIPNEAIFAFAGIRERFYQPVLTGYSRIILTNYFADTSRYAPPYRVITINLDEENLENMTPQDRRALYAVDAPY
jgi:hypothetical protein